MTLSCRGLESHYGAVQILRGIDLDIPAGQITGLIGPNGAGKSTALKALFGLVRPSAGKVLLDETDTTGWSPGRMVQAGVCFVPQGRAVFPSLSVAENLRMGAFHETKTVQQQRRTEVFGRFPRLQERAGQNAGSLSGGEQQMLAIGRALMADPQVVLLDEPTVGLAPRAVTEVRDVIEGLRAEGRAVAVVEQNVRLALQMSDHAFVLVRGEIALAGPGAALLDDPRVRDVYLGKASDRAETVQ